MFDMSKFSKYAQKQRETDNERVKSPVTVLEEQQIHTDIATSESSALYDTPAEPVAGLDAANEYMFGEYSNEIYVPSEMTYDDDIVEAVKEDTPDELPAQTDLTENISDDEIMPLSDEDIIKEIDRIIVKYFSDNIQLIETERLVNYRNHTFSPLPEAQMSSLASSIERLGMQDAILVRSIGSGEYEIISGHNRKIAAEMLEWRKVPCRVADNELLTPEIADEIMVSCNLDRRSELKHSELARSLSLLMEARKNQQNDDDDKGRTREKVAAEFGMSESQVQRYITLNKLNDELLGMVDDGAIPFVAGTILADLSESQQNILLEALQLSKKKVTTQLAEQIKKAAAVTDTFTVQSIKELLTAKPKPTPKITVSSSIVSKYLAGKTAKEAEEIIEKALAAYLERNE